MKFNKFTFDHLTGDKFSAGLDIDFGQGKYKEQNRIEKILELTKNKSVIHIGCADHLPLIENKIKSRKWLHGLLNETTSECVGVDINKEAIEFIKNKLNISNVYIANNDTINYLLGNEKKWDMMVLGEIIEHVDNPVSFLQDIHITYKNNVNHIIISAPNVYNLLTVNDILNNKENINTDHRYWFSPFTLSKIVHNSGFTDIEIFFVERVKLPFLKAILKRIKTILRIPLTYKANCFSNIILVAKF